MAATALIADHDERFRGSVRKLIEGLVRVVGEAEGDETAISMAQALKPDVLLIDFDLPLVGGIETARQIKSKQPAIRVVLMTGHGEEAYLEATGKSGADEFLSKQHARAEAPAVMRRLASGVSRSWEGLGDRRRRG